MKQVNQACLLGGLEGFKKVATFSAVLPNYHNQSPSPGSSLVPAKASSPAPAPAKVYGKVSENWISPKVAIGFPCLSG